MKIRYINYKKKYSKLGKSFHAWVSFDRFFSGKVIHINVKHHTLEIDLR